MRMRMRVGLRPDLIARRIARRRRPLGLRHEGHATPPPSERWFSTDPLAAVKNQRSGRRWVTVGRLADHVFDAAVQGVEGGPDRRLPDVFADTRDTGELLAAAGAEHGERDQYRAVATGRR